MVLHASLGGVTAPLQQQMYTAKDRRGENWNVMGNAAANGQFLLFYFFIHE